jgi:hypothetical protein
VARKRARSRRLYHLSNSLRPSEYFTLPEIRHREPAYYQLEFLDKFSESQRQASEQRARERAGQAGTIAEQILDGVDRAEYWRVVERARREAREAEEEEEESEDEEEGNLDERTGEDEKNEGNSEPEADAESDSEGTEELAPEDDPMAVSEFTRATEQRWLAGADPNFEYKLVDEDEANDDERVKNQDIEDAYFAEDDDEDRDEVERNEVGEKDVLAVRRSGAEDEEYDY